MKTLWKQSVMAGLILALLIGCRGAPSPLAEEEQIVVLWHSFTGQESVALQTLSDDFNATSDHVVLITEYQTDILTKLRGVPAEHRPDLVVIWPEDVPVYHQADLIAGNHVWPIPVRQEAEDILPMARALYTVGDDVLAFPLGLGTYLAYYNVDWLSDLGHVPDFATWEDLRVTTCAATNPTRGRIGLGLPAHPSAFLALLTSGGATIIGADGRYNFADPAGIRTVDVLNQIFGGGCGLVYTSLEEGLARFSHSAAALIVESSLRRFDVERAVVAGRNFSLGIEAPPGPFGPGRTLWYGPGLTVIAPSGPRLQAAQEVLTWFFTPAAQMTWSTTTNYLPIRRSLVEAQSAALTSPTEYRLAQVALRAADEDSWIAWPRYTNAITCRAGLLRGMLALDGNIAPSLVAEMTTSACNSSLPQSSAGGTP